MKKLVKAVHNIFLSLNALPKKAGRFCKAFGTKPRTAKCIPADKNDYETAGAGLVPCYGETGSEALGSVVGVGSSGGKVAVAVWDACPC